MSNVFSNITSVSGAYMYNNIFDLIVIGGGLAGVSAAMHAAKQGMSVVIVERNSNGGASTQASAGHVMTGFLPSPDEMNIQLGEMRTNALQKWSHASKLALRNEILSRIGKDALENGYFFLGRGSKDKDVLIGMLKYWHNTLEISDLMLQMNADFSPILKKTSFDFALFDPTGFTIKRSNLRKLVSGMADEPGITRLFGTSVENIDDKRTGTVEIVTDIGVIKAQRVAVCAGQHTPNLIHNIPNIVADHVVFGDVHVANTNSFEFGSEAVSASDCSHDPIYFTALKNGSIHFGAPLDCDTLIDPKRQLLVKFQATFPELIVRDLSNVRTATVDRTASGLPVIGLVSPRIAVAYGFSGVGLAASFGAGEQIATALAKSG